MLKKIRQSFNIVRNGDVVGNDKIVYNIMDGKKSEIYINELFYLLILNSKKRITYHEAALKAIMKLNSSEDPYWLDETDVVLDNLHKYGNNLDADIEAVLKELKEISPRLHAIFNDYFNHEINIRSAINPWLVLPDNHLIAQTGHSFPSIYIRSIENMKENIEFLVDQTEKFKVEYFKHKI